MKDLGVLVPLVTPCKPDGQVDTDGLKSLCRHLAHAGCHSFFVGGSTGRGPWFSRPERKRICRAVVQARSPGVTVCAGCMALGLPDMLENARAMADAGADLAVLTAPGYFQYSPDEIEAIFLKFADASPLPLIFYDVPAFAGARLDAQMVCRLAAHPKVVGFKDSSGDMSSFRRLADALGARDAFYLLQGKEHLLVESLSCGASGFVVSLVHMAPHLFVDLFRAARAGSVEQARCLQARITVLYQWVCSCLERRAGTSTLFHILNVAVREQGLCDNILLDHEGATPDWLRRETIDVLQSVRTGSECAGPTPQGTFAAPCHGARGHG